MGECPHAGCTERVVSRPRAFPVADVSDYLEQPDTVVWVDLCGPSEERAPRARRQELGLHELAVEDALGPHQRPKLDHYATHLFLSCHAVRVDADTASSTRPRSTRSSTTAGSSPSARTTASRWTPCSQRWDRSPDLRSTRRQLPALRPARRRRRRLLRRRPGVRRLLRRGQRGDLRRTAARRRRSNATGSRCAGRWCASTAWSCRCGRRSAR